MRTLVSSFIVGVCLVASPALAQQHPWVASCVYDGNCFGNIRHADASARADSRIRGISPRHHQRNSGDK
jgi:hypothetical protein